jgi:hypothetical protein
MEAYPEVDAWQTFPEPGGWLGEWRLVFRLLAYLRRQGIKHAVLNTAEGNLIRKLSLAAGRHTEFTGILHLSSKLWTSTSQKIISRKVRKYFVLAEFIKENLEQAGRGSGIESFYPIYFPAGGNDERLQEPAYRICVPGAVDFARRDYGSLLEELQASDVPSQVGFVLLGRTSSRDGQELAARVKGLGLEQYFTLYESFIPHGEFYRVLRQAWLVLPLITPRCSDYEDYRAYKITGSFNLAYGFRLPLLLHESFSDKRIYRETAEFYPEGGLLAAIRRLTGDPAILKARRERMAVLPEFRFEAQAEKYIRFIHGTHRSRP